MRILFSLFLCVTPFICNGQAFLRASAGAAYTALMNKDDRNGAGGIDNRLTFRPTVGLELGSRFRDGSDFHSFAIGVHYVNIAQNYAVTGQFPSLLDSAEGVRSVQYLRVPFTFSIALSHRGRLRPLLAFGAYYARLIGHRDAFSRASGGNTLLEYEAANGAYSSMTYNFTMSGTYEGSYYKRFDAGAFAGFSVESNLGRGLFLDVGVRASRGLTKIENRKYLNHTLSSGGFTTDVPINAYQADSYLPMFGVVIPPHAAEYSKVRAQSYTFSAGIEVGLKYLLSRRDEPGAPE